MSETTTLVDIKYMGTCRLKYKHCVSGGEGVRDSQRYGNEVFNMQQWQGVKIDGKIGVTIISQSETN